MSRIPTIQSGYLKASIPPRLCRSNASEKCDNNNKNLYKKWDFTADYLLFQNQEILATNDRFKCIKQISNAPNFQDENGRGNQKYHLQRGMDSFSRHKRCLLSYPHTQKSQKMISDRSVVSVSDTSF